MMSQPSSTHLSTSPSQTPLRPRPISLISDDGRLSPLPRPGSARIEASRPLLGTREQYFHPGCTLCSLVASLPSPHEQEGMAEPASATGSGSGLAEDEEGEYDLGMPTATAGPSRDRARTPNSVSPPSKRPAYSHETSDYHNPYENPPRPSTTSQNGLMPPSRGTLSTMRMGAGTSSGGGMNRPIKVSGREVVFFDEDITVYKASGKERLCAEGKHLVVVINRHVERIYDLSPADVPVLSHMLDVTRQLLADGGGSDVERGQKGLDFRIGFVGSMIRDPMSPYNHLHAHAMLGPPDKTAAGNTFYRRNVIFGNLNWWSIEDLRAEIREESSNNRVKSGYDHRQGAPIEKVPDAGSVQGLPNAIDPAPYQDSLITPTHTFPPPQQSQSQSQPLETPPVRRHGKGKSTSASTSQELRLDGAGLPLDSEEAEYQPVKL